LIRAARLEKANSRFVLKSLRSKTGCLILSLHFHEQDHADNAQPEDQEPESSQGRQKREANGNDRNGIDEGPGRVESFPPGLGPLALQLPEDQQDHDQAQGHVNPEHAAPGEVLGQEAPQEGAEGEAGVHSGHVDSQGPAPLLRGKDRGQDGNARGKDHGPADPLKHPQGDEHEHGL
jgi:hypothetical protein